MLAELGERGLQWKTMTVLGDGSVLLQASTFDVGPELFRASPDRPVPELVLDIWPGGDSRPYDFVARR